MNKLLFFALFLFPALILIFENGKIVSYAEEDPIEEDEVEVEGEADVEEVGATEEYEDDTKSLSSPYADTTLLFVKPELTGASQMEIPAGLPVEFLVGFRNKGDQDFIVDTLEASFRYPMDFNFYIQNFSAIGYRKIIAPEKEATFHYSFLPSEAFAGRPFGLNIMLNYHDSNGNPFQEAVFNETVQVVELEEGLDGETFFLYVFLAAGVVLLLVIGQQTLLSVGKKRSGGSGGSSRKSAPVETGTNNPNNVDYDWLPPQVIASLSKEKVQKSPKSKPQSPRQRKVKRTTGSE
ncbi:translocon-associated protein subunit alpha [Diorhabda carinulata]|uniref:translocon-associated protein subunit alpha n=1 Tax=Diorhabda carinulata TaxID=1163345 RepID=UPI0024E06BCA|nr:translocon-associated protein subunit alpha isoform X2 [Diorhabda sublineata]XP_057652598.1 translocon-associated protein subunit alpha [Diorhabda carinulata]